jgi:hypothetical protein
MMWFKYVTVRPGQQKMQNATKEMSQYVIMEPISNSPPLAVTLEVYPDVVILDELDESNVLVEMSEEARDRIRRELPQLVVEPNLPYTTRLSLQLE